MMWSQPARPKCVMKSCVCTLGSTGAGRVWFVGLCRVFSRVLYEPYNLSLAPMFWSTRMV